MQGVMMLSLQKCKTSLFNDEKTRSNHQASHHSRLSAKSSEALKPRWSVPWSP